MSSLVRVKKTWLRDGGKEPAGNNFLHSGAVNRYEYSLKSACDGKIELTFCINKANNNELSEAISSMFRWYQNAAKCYVYLLDVPRAAFDEFNQRTWESDFRESRWFTRGWTLQELLAPVSGEFFSREREGRRLGDKRTLERQIHEITGICCSSASRNPSVSVRCR